MPFTGTGFSRRVNRLDGGRRRGTKRGPERTVRRLPGAQPVRQGPLQLFAVSDLGGGGGLG